MWHGVVTTFYMYVRCTVKRYAHNCCQWGHCEFPCGWCLVKISRLLVSCGHTMLYATGIVNSIAMLQSVCSTCVSDPTECSGQCEDCAGREQDRPGEPERSVWEEREEGTVQLCSVICRKPSRLVAAWSVKAPKLLHFCSCHLFSWWLLHSCVSIHMCTDCTVWWVWIPPAQFFSLEKKSCPRCSWLVCCAFAFLYTL